MANKYERSRLIPSANVTTLLYEVPAATTAICRSLRITNTNSSRTEVSAVQVDSASALTITILDQHVISPRSEYDALNGVPLNLEAGDKIRVTATVANVNFYLSYVEIDRN